MTNGCSNQIQEPRSSYVKCVGSDVEPEQAGKCYLIL